MKNYVTLLPFRFGPERKQIPFGFEIYLCYSACQKFEIVKFSLRISVMCKAMKLT